MPITLGHLPNELPFGYRLREWGRSWWYRLAREWEPVVVNKSVDSITMPKWIAIGILGAIFTFGIQSWWRSSDQRDMMIEMKTELRMLKESRAAEDAERKAQAAEERAWREVMNGNQKTIQGMLSQQQRDALETIRRSGKEN